MFKQMFTLIAILTEQNLSDIFIAVDTPYVPGTASGNWLSNQPDFPRG